MVGPGGAGGGGSPARPIDKLTDDEIGAVVRGVLAREFAMSTESLIVAAARELGYQRTGVRIRTRVDGVLQRLRQDGTLTDVGGNLRLADA